LVKLRIIAICCWQAHLGSRHGRQHRYALGGERRLILGRGEVASEVDRRVGRVQAECKTVSSTEHIGRIAGPALNRREGEEAEIIAEAFAGFRCVGLGGEMPLAHQFDRRAAVAKEGGRIRIGGGEEVGLERFQRVQFEQRFASLNERLIRERSGPVVRRFEGRLSTEPGGEVDPPNRVAR